MSHQTTTTGSASAPASSSPHSPSTSSTDEQERDTHSHAHSHARSHSKASRSRVGFAPSASSSSSSSPLSLGEQPQRQLKESLLASSFIDSTSGPLTDIEIHSTKQGSSSTSQSQQQGLGDIQLQTMSDKRLIATSGQKYSSLAQDESDRESDMDGHTHNHHAMGHGHSHGNGAHGHSHNGGKSRSSSSGSARVSRNVRSSVSPPTPRRSPVDNCGGLRSRQRGTAIEESNRKARKQLTWASLCCMVFMVCEIIGGFLANSLAIMTDAAHLLSDLAGFLISIFALWLATRPATSRLSFGFHRAEILGALISVLLIWLLTGILVYEAVWRLMHPQDVDGKIMFIVATLGLLVNFTMGIILLQGGHGHSHGLGGLGGHEHGHSHGGDSKKVRQSSRSLNAHSEDEEEDEDEEEGHGHSHSASDHGHSHMNVSSDSSGSPHGHSHGGHDDHENLNVKAAFIHVLGDALQSAGVMIAAGIIWYEPEWKIADPLCTFLFSILVLFTTTRLIKQSVAVLMEGVPEGLDPDDVEEALRGVPGVIAVHDLHIWSLSVGKPALSVHLYCRDDATHVLAAANKTVAINYNIHHSTIQVERQHDDIECNDAFNPDLASLDHVTEQNFSELGVDAEDATNVV